MSAAAARVVLRPTRLALRRAPARHASTTSEAAAKAKDTASQATSKASEGLTKVSQSAGSAASSASNAASNAASALTARAGALGNVVNSKAPLASACIRSRLADLFRHSICTWRCLLLSRHRRARTTRLPRPKDVPSVRIHTQGSGRLELGKS